MFYTFYAQRGNNILLRYKKPNDNTTYTSKLPYKPRLYLPSEEKSNYTSIYDQNLKEIEFDDIWEAKKFAENYRDIEDLDVSGNSNYANQFIVDIFEGQSPEYQTNQIRISKIDIEVDTDGSFPDPVEAKYPINGCTIYDNVDKKWFVFALRHNPEDEWSQENSEEEFVRELTNVEFQIFDTEKDLVRAILENFQQQQYDIATGWNSEGFDIPYTVNRAIEIFGNAYVKKMLSPFGEISSREHFNKFGQKQQKVNILGLSQMDYMEMYRKHIYTPRESYKLDYISYVELGEKKVDYDEAGSLHSLWRTNFQKFVDYNIKDVWLMEKLDEKLALFDLTFAVAYYSLSNIEDTMGTVALWQNLVAKFLYGKGQVPPFRKKKTEHREFDGAFVKEVDPGFYDWVVSFDLKSLYPHIEMQWNIGPETHIPFDQLPDELKQIKEDYTFDDLVTGKADLSALQNYDITMAANFEFYRTDKQSFFAEIKEHLYKERKHHKNQMLEFESLGNDATQEKDKKRYEILESKANNMQMGLKVGYLNAGYGALANEHFLYYMVENAEAITLSGQLVNRRTSGNVDRFLSKMFNKKTSWVAGDTDSFYMTIAPFMETVKETDIQKRVDQADRFCKEVMQPFIDQQCDDIRDYFNCYAQRMKWNREVIASEAFWVVKKKYAMNVWDSERIRYKEPKMKITGLEAKKSSYPEWAKELMKECYEIILSKDEPRLHEKLEEVWERFLELKPDDIAIPSGINGIEKYYDEKVLYKHKTPGHVKAAINHNYLVDKLELRHIPKITSGSKIKTLKLKVPNPYKFTEIGFDTYMPREFNLEPYINRDTIYEKSFMSPIRAILDAVGWTEEEIITL